eukprot:EST45230.1 Hypothetical protein SS50377_14805 [Spironucleus salmonicida]
MELQLAIRQPNQFPYPNQITYEGADSELTEFNASLPQSQDVGRLDSQVQVSEDFLTQFTLLSDHISENYQEQENSQEVIAYFKIAAQLPPVNSIGVQIRKVTKTVKIPLEVAKFYESSQAREMLLSATTRKWQGEDRYESMYRLFGLCKLFFHLKIIKNDRVGEIICCLFTNTTLSISQSKQLLFQDKGVLHWILVYKQLDTSLFKAGIYGKLLDLCDYFKAILHPKQTENSDEIQEVLNINEVKTFLYVFKLIITSKSFKVPYKQLSAGQKAIKMISDTLDDHKIREIADQIDNIFRKIKK